jgi:alcohol dehydrogenase
MKALVYTGTTQVEYREEPDPLLGEGYALLRTEATGICGGDMHAYFGHDSRRVPPLILGHEVVGVVEKGARAGERMLANPFISCGRCRYCVTGRSNICPNRKLIGMNIGGTFAEYVAVPEGNLIPVPEGLDASKAVLAEPLAASVHAFELAARAWSCPFHEARTLVLGAGAVGLAAALLLRDRRVAEIVVGETNPARRASAQEAGFEVYDPATAAAEARHFDLVFDAVGGGATRAAAIAAVADGGVIAHTGLQDNQGAVDMRRVTLAEITIIGTYAYTQANLAEALASIHRGVLGDAPWVDCRPLHDGDRAFADLAAGRCRAAKVVLQP